MAGSVLRTGDIWTAQLGKNFTSRYWGNRRKFLVSASQWSLYFYKAFLMPHSFQVHIPKFQGFYFILPLQYIISKILIWQEKMCTLFVMKFIKKKCALYLFVYSVYQKENVCGFCFWQNDKKSYKRNMWSQCPWAELSHYQLLCRNYYES